MDECVAQFYMNGKLELSMDREQMTAKPIKYVTQAQRYMSFDWDLAGDHMWIHFNGVNVLYLPIGDKGAPEKESSCCNIQ